MERQKLASHKELRGIDNAAWFIHHFQEPACNELPNFRYRYVASYITYNRLNTYQNDRLSCTKPTRAWPLALSLFHYLLSHLTGSVRRFIGAEIDWVCLAPCTHVVQFDDISKGTVGVLKLTPIWSNVVTPFLHNSISSPFRSFSKSSNAHVSILSTYY